MAASIFSEIILGAPENRVVGNTISKDGPAPKSGLGLFHVLRLTLSKDILAVARLEPKAPIPSWAREAKSFASITRTANELSIVCPAHLIPNGTKVESSFRALKIEGVLDFSLTGILASVTTPLANAGISIFAISTFDTDYVLVKEDKLVEAIAVLREAGHQISSVGRD